jgi:pyridoxine 5-phosphate synthase
MPLLGVNVDHVATLRQARRVAYPDPVEAAIAAQRAGAAAITVHLREDRRHIQDYDLLRIRDAIRIHLNQEMAPVHEMVEIAIAIKPHEVCLVPERREELTTEGGLDAAGQIERLAPIVDRLKKCGIGVSLFIDPQTHQIEAAARLGADFVELHTGTYATLADADLATADARVAARSSKAGKSNAHPRASAIARIATRAALGAPARAELAKIRTAVKTARALKLRPNAGHGLNYRNVGLIAAIPGLVWLHIGHAIVARAILVGMERAVREMNSLMGARITTTPITAAARRATASAARAAVVARD